MSKTGNNFFKKYLTFDGQNPLFLGFVCGIYPFLFYVSNNFYGTNSWAHWGYFTLFFIGLPIIAFCLLLLLINSLSSLKKWQRHILFIGIIFVTAFFLSWAGTLLIKKKILLGVLVVSTLLSLKLFDRYKKLFVLVGVLCVLPLLKIGYKLYDSLRAKEWLTQPDRIVETRFVKTPNVYMIQPDGYVSETMLSSDLYGNSESDIYDWLRSKSFKLYDGFRSNYPASLNSNSSMFAMRQHQFGSSLFPDLEMPDAREVISGDNPVVDIFKKNGYFTFFVAEDEYFQQNRAPQLYDYFNIDVRDAKFFSKGETIVKDVYKDVQLALEVEVDTPKFFFIEKCLPHHVHFYAEGDRIAEERKEYLENVQEVNGWIKETIKAIEEKDPNALIIVLADHGGWVGHQNYADMFSNKEPNKINSVFANLMAVKWNGNLPDTFDDDLKTNVNVFRVLFSALSEDPKLLENLEDNSSYNLRHKNSFFKGVTKVIDNDGRVIYKEL